MFVDGVSGAPANSFASDDPLCLLYWERAPLNLDGAAHFIRGIRPTDIAAMITSKSRTPPAVREAAIRSPPGPQATGRMSRPKTTEPGSGGLSDCVRQEFARRAPFRVI